MKVVLRDTQKTERETHATYMRDWRTHMTDEQKAKNNEQSKLRMKMYRQRKALEKRGETPRTRQEDKKEEERKRKQRESKAKYRAKLSSQKKRRIREKDARTKKDKRGSKCQSQPSQSQPSQSQPSQSQLSFNKYVYRSFQMPKSPNKYAKVIKRLTSNVTPKRKAALAKEGIGLPVYCKKNLTDVLGAVKEANNNLKGRSGKQKQKRKEFFQLFKSLNKSKESQQLFCCATGIKRKYLTSTCFEDKPRKRRRDALPVEMETSIKGFFEEETISTNIPDRRAVNKDLEPKKVMQSSLSTAYKTWTGENTNNSILYTTFCRLKPKHVLPQKHRKLFQCLCEYCENVKLKLKCLYNIVDREQVTVKDFKDEFSAVRNTLCVTSDKFANLTCIDRNCEECGTWLLKEKVQPILQHQGEVKWSRWENVKTTNPKTHKLVTKQQVVTKTGPAMSLWEELEKELGPMACHLFEAKWQQEQFSILHKTENFPEKTLSLTMDFAENFTCFSQNEIQAAHWAQDSVTLHPIIARYRCPRKECHDLVEECIDVVSDDLLHDCHAVHSFTEKVFDYVKNERQVELEHAIVISDGCAAQYKSKVPFMDVSCSISDFGVSMERCYYGSRHGKNRCDGEAGVVKSMARRAVKNGAHIKDARSFFDVVQKLSIPRLQNTCNINYENSCLFQPMKLRG